MFRAELVRVRRVVVMSSVILVVVCMSLLGPLSISTRSEESFASPSGDHPEGYLSTVKAALQERIQGEQWTYGQEGSSCGIYAACRSLMLLGVEADPGRYFTVDYMANAEGSTPKEIVRIIESRRCQAVPMVNLSKLDIVATGCPIIANVRTPDTSLFNHWVCVLFVNQRLIVFDGAAGPVVMSFAEFLPLWNGYGIVVSKREQPVIMTVWLLRAGALLGFLFVGLLCWFMASRVHSPQLRSVVRMASVCLSLSLTGNLVFGDISRTMHGVRSAASSSRAESESEELDVILTSAVRNYVLIDARYRGAYESGAIEGAVNIPVGTSEIALRGLFQGIDRNVPLLVYCQSSSCGWDTVLGGKLQWLGFRNVHVSKIGWKEYSTTTSDRARPDPSDSVP